MTFVDYAKVGKILVEKLGLERSTWRNEWGIGTKSDVSKLLDAHLCSSLLAYISYWLRKSALSIYFVSGLSPEAGYPSENKKGNSLLLQG